jgi:DNA polymerase-3 subunit epsilon
MDALGRDVGDNRAKPVGKGNVNWVSRIFRKKPGLSLQQRERLAAWRVLPRLPLSGRLDASRFVVVDVESSGLNLALDRLIAIGAVAVTNGRIDMADSFDVVLQQSEFSSHDNILIHGIGEGAQSAGVPPSEALLNFLEYLGKSPLVAFHVTFDATMIGRAIAQHLGFRFQHDWLDLAYVVPALNSRIASQCRLLDHWQAHFGIINHARHNAVADAVSTAQLFMIAMRQAREQRIHSYQGMQQLEKAQRWVRRESGIAC